MTTAAAFASDDQPTTPELPSALRLSWSLASIGSALSTAVGALVLVGWATGTEVLKRGGTGLVTMKANTAACFILLGAGLWVSRRGWRRGHVLRRIAATVGALVGALTLMEYILGIDLHLDQALFAESSAVIATTAPGRMAPTTAACFVLLGIALATRGSWRPTRFRRTDVLILLAAAAAFLALAGYLYGASALYGLGNETQMAMHTSVTFLVLCASAIAASPRRTFAAIFLRASPGGTVARRLVPAALFVPIVVGWLRLAGERAGLYDTALGLSIMVVSVVTIFSGLAIWIGTTLDREHGRRLVAERTAATDTLTGLANRRAMTDRLQRLMAASDDSGIPFSVLAIDADGLKKLNDGYGHAAGDRSLQRLAQAVRGAVREIDLAARVGGDEFLVLLPDTTVTAAREITDRLKAAIDHQEPVDGVPSLRASIGLAVWSADSTAEEVLAAADQALYDVKRERSTARAD